jgi:hypothetical protein
MVGINKQENENINTMTAGIFKESTYSVCSLDVPHLALKMLRAIVFVFPFPVY